VSIVVSGWFEVPYLAGTADERQYRVMIDRESWSRIVMGQGKVAKIKEIAAFCEVSLRGLRGGVNPQGRLIQKGSA